MPKLMLEITNEKLLDLLMQISLEEIEAILKQVRSGTISGSGKLKTRNSPVDASFGIWAKTGSGADYVNDIRDEAETRLKEMKIG